MISGNKIENIRESFQVGKLTKSNLSELCKIDEEVFSCKINEKDFEVYESRLDVYPEGQISIFLDNKLVAFATTEIWGKEHKMIDNVLASEKHEEDGNIIYISIMAVSKDFQKKGMGNLILQEIKKLSVKNINIEKILLKTSRAREFYEKNNFIFREFVRVGNGGYSIMEFFIDRE